MYLSVNVFRIQRLFLFACSYDNQKSSGVGVVSVTCLGVGMGAKMDVGRVA